MGFIEHYDHPHRIYVGRTRKRHVHHFWHGVWLLVLAIVLIVSDWKDKPWSFSDDRDRYAPRKNREAPG